LRNSYAGWTAIAGGNRGKADRPVKSAMRGGEDLFPRIPDLPKRRSVDQPARARSLSEYSTPTGFFEVDEVNRFLHDAAFLSTRMVFDE
jgi:hypothetical protein